MRRRGKRLGKRRGRAPALSEALRQEVLGDGIRVTVVEPGAVATELTDHITDEEVREGLKRRNVEPPHSEDLANAAAYAIGQPQRVGVNEILILPTGQANRVGQPVTSL